MFTAVLDNEVVRVLCQNAVQIILSPLSTRFVDGEVAVVEGVSGNDLASQKGCPVVYTGGSSSCRIDARECQE